MSEHYITIHEMAGLARSHPATVRRWINEGKLASRKIGHKRLIRASEAKRVLGFMPPQPGEAS